MRRLIFVCSSPSFLDEDGTKTENGSEVAKKSKIPWAEFIADDLQEQDLLPNYLFHTADEASRQCAIQIAKRAREQRRFSDHASRPKRVRSLPILKQQRLLPFDRPDFTGELPRELWTEVIQLILSMLNSGPDGVGLIIAAEPTLKRLRERIEPLLRTSVWEDHAWYAELIIQNDARGFLQPSHLPRR